MRWPIGLSLAIVFDFVIRVVRSRIVDLTGKKIDVVLAADIFEHILAVKMANRPTSVGILANQMRDFDSVREFFTSGTVIAATDLFFALIFIIVLFIIAGPLAWIPLLMLPIVIGTGFLLQRPLERAMKQLQAESVCPPRRVDRDPRRASKLFAPPARSPACRPRGSAPSPPPHAPARTCTSGPRWH